VRGGNIKNLILSIKYNLIKRLKHYLNKLLAKKLTRLNTPINKTSNTNYKKRRCVSSCYLKLNFDLLTRNFNLVKREI